MSSSLLLELTALLEEAEQKIFNLEKILNEAVWEGLNRNLLYLCNKHMPAELCSEIKLLERIYEAVNLLEEIKMAELQSDLTVDYETLLACAKAAISRWSGPEGTKAKALQKGCKIDVEFTRQWLSEWGLSISNPNKYRENLAVFLSDVARPAILIEHERSLPELVEKLVIEMQAANAAKNRQTSLISKFAFSLRPETLVPYDKRARSGIRSAIGAKVIEHDYVDYMKKFNTYILPAAGEALDKHNISNKLIEDWQPIMTKELFVRRTADKLFMVLGGFDPKNL